MKIEDNIKILQMYKTRASNFTKDEQKLLMFLVKKYPIIEKNKKTDNRSSALKRRAWRSLATEFNSKTTGEMRSAIQLSHCYRNYRWRSKKQLQSGALNEHEYATTSESPVVVIESIEDNLPETFKDIESEIQINSKQKDKENEENVQLFDNIIFCDDISDDIDFFNENNSNTFEQPEQSEKRSPSPQVTKESNEIGPSEAILELAKEKLKLIGIKNDAVKRQSHHQKQVNSVNLELIKEKLNFERKKNQLELEFQRQKKKIELQFLKEKCKLELNLIRQKLNED